MSKSSHILVAGGTGQVARALQERAAAAGVSLSAIGRPDFDISNEADTQRLLDAQAPFLLINAAAYTAVDQAESDIDNAMRINADAPGILARQAASRNIPLIHLSTDYVYDGTKQAAYVETDPTGPTGVYGQSKLSGEREVRTGNPNHLICRTAWVYSAFGKNFVKTMLRLADTRDEVGVVADQVGNPTSATDIADALLQLAETVRQSGTVPHPGTFHMAGSGETSWAGLAEFIFAVSAELGGPVARVNSITTAEYPTPARRPANSRLDTSAIEKAYGVKLPDWRVSVRACVERLINTKDWNS